MNRNTSGVRHHFVLTIYECCTKIYKNIYHKRYINWNDEKRFCRMKVEKLKRLFQWFSNSPLRLRFKQSCRAEILALRSADSSHLSSQLSQLDHHQTEPFSYLACWSSARWEEMRRRMAWRLLCTSREVELSSPRPPWKANNEGWSIYEPWDFEVCIRAKHQLPMIAPDNDQERKQGFVVICKIFNNTQKSNKIKTLLGIRRRKFEGDKTGATCWLFAFLSLLIGINY